MTIEESQANAERSQLTPSLVADLRQGDAGASEVLDRLWRLPILRYCLGILRNEAEAEDAVQGVFIKVLKSEVIPDDFKAWIYKIARNHCLNMLRGEGRRKDDGDMPEHSIAEPGVRGPLTRVAHEERLHHLIEVLDELPEGFKEVLRLRYVEDLSRSQVADVLDISQSVVKSRLFEGMKMLRKHESLMDSLT